MVAMPADSVEESMIGWTTSNDEVFPVQPTGTDSLAVISSIVELIGSIFGITPPRAVRML